MKKSSALSGTTLDTSHKLTGSKGLPSSISRPTAMIDELIDHRLAAILLGVSARTLARWHLRGEGPPRISYGRSIKYRRASIEEWLRRRETAGRRRR
jgi:predicted DNA-binding transcriptional regulator AlpA